MRRPEASAPDLARPIPLELPSVAGWKEVSIVENGEPLVPLGAFSDHHYIATSSVYAGQHNSSPYWREDRKLVGSLMTQFVRAGVAEQLRFAQSLLPPRHYLIVLDSYRSLETQSALYDHYLKKLRFRRPDWDEAALSAETQKYVSVPSYDSARPSPHNTGGAVDLAIFTLSAAADERLRTIDSRLAVLRPAIPVDPTPEQEAYDPALREQYLLEMERISLVRLHGRVLNFGTPFDYGGPEAAANYLEHAAMQRRLTAEENQGLMNRRLLHGVMTAAGLSAYPDEWWHFNSPKSQMGARAAGLSHAEYGAAVLSSENRAHEAMRAAHHAGVVRIQESLMVGRHLGTKAGGTWDDLIALNERALRETGDPRLTYLAKAAVIEPSQTV